MSKCIKANEEMQKKRKKRKEKELRTEKQIKER